MNQVSFVTGANGHLGNNLVRLLLSKGETVKAGVRDIKNTEAFTELDCELVYAEMLNEQAMSDALKGVDILYHVAAVFKHWAKDPQSEIVQANLKGTEIVLKAAAKNGVRKIVYVSSVAAVGHDGNALDEHHWNTETQNAYYHSKIISEQRAWQLAKELNLQMVAVLPSAMVGPNALNLTDTMQFIESIRLKNLPFDPNFHFNFVDVRDVAKGLHAASIKGQNGQRYILANENSSDLKQIIEAANTIKPRYRNLPKVPKWLLLFIAWCMEIKSKLDGKPADMINSQIRLFYGIKQEYDISKAKRELGFSPRSDISALTSAFTYLEQKTLGQA
jgi:dihydroflavonol-4-reductase